MRPLKIPFRRQPRAMPAWTNDTHSALNRTHVTRVIEARSAEEVVKAVERARHYRAPLAIAGGRHAMGGQQFLTGGSLLDTCGLKRVRALDEERGLLEVEGGITWPDVIRGYRYSRTGHGPDGEGSQWGIRQKPTGADRHTIGGAVATNIHGCCLTAAPFIADIESLEVVTADAELVRCSRDERAELFRHVVGGYGLFGVVTAATLRLTPRKLIQREVEMLEVDGLMDRLREKIAGGASYGDFQFAIDPGTREFLRTGILTCYCPVSPVGDSLAGRSVRTNRAIPPRQHRLSKAGWHRLLELAHRDKRRAFVEYSAYCASTSGQLYWSDTHQLNVYFEEYHGSLDERLGAHTRGCEMITEICVPRLRLATFMDDVRQDFLRHPVDLITGTVRLIEPDRESALSWAKEAYACVRFNLHVDHDSQKILAAVQTFIRLIDLGIAHGGTYYLAHHRFARPDQLLTCHPSLRKFIATKQRLDPEGIFQNDWYQHLLLTSGKLS